MGQIHTVLPCSLYVLLNKTSLNLHDQLHWQLHLKVRTRLLELVFQPRFTYLLCSRCALAANHWFCFLIKFLFTQRVHDLWTQLSSHKAPTICIKSHFCIGWQDNLMFFFFPLLRRIKDAFTAALFNWTLWCGSQEWTLVALNAQWMK